MRMQTENGYGVLFIVATPIGNAKDMSPRGINILQQVDMIAAEDTRRSVVLLNKLGIHNKLVSNHKFNEHGRARFFIDLMKSGQSVAVITDAGTPCISDPGNELIRSAIAENIQVVGIPGCCAAVTALSISGFDLSVFTFQGFFPRENAERRKIIQQMRRSGVRTHVFYESPKRIMSAVEYFMNEQIPCNICLCNDLTKLYEEVFRGSPREVREQLLAKGNFEKGEFCLVLELEEAYLHVQKEHIVSPEALLVEMMVCRGCKTKEAIQAVMEDEANTYSKKELYAASIRLKELFAQT